jgi:hypothetical protein
MVVVPVALVPAEKTAVSPGFHAPVVSVPAESVDQLLLVPQMPVVVLELPAVAPLLSQ